MFATENDEASSYEEFRIELSPASNRTGYILRATSPNGLEVSFDYQLPVANWEIDEAFAGLSRATSQYTRSAPRSTADDVRALGERLFTSICENRVTSLFKHALGAASDSGRILRLRLVIADPAVAALPWEFLFDPSRQDFVTLSARSPFVRQWKRSKVSEPPPVIEPPLRVLVVAAEVNNLDTGADEEIGLLEHLGKRHDAGLKLVRVIRDATPERFVNALARDSYDVLHFILSGATPEVSEGWRYGASRSGSLPPSESLLFNGNPGSGSFQVVKAYDLMSRLRPQKDLQLVCLSGDCTDWLACMLSEVSPATIGWRGINTFEAYIAFTEGLYSTLLTGSPLETAVTHGRKAIDARYPGGKEWGMPVFYMQTSHGAALQRRRQTVNRISPGINLKSGKKGKLAARQPSNSAAQREWRKVQMLLSAAEQNHSALVAESGKYEAGAVPKYITTQLKELKATISRLKAELERLAS